MKQLPEDDRAFRNIILILWALLAICALALVATSAEAHMAQTGWAYPTNCCSDNDCEMMPIGAVREVRGGYAVPDGEVIPHSDGRIKPSPDGRYHWCHRESINEAGEPYSRTICLFVPHPGS